MNSDIHGYQKRLEGALRSVEKSEKISDQDKELITKFSTVLRIQRLNTGRVAKYVWHLKTTAKRLNELNHSERGLSSATKEDIDMFSIWVNESKEYKPRTKRDYSTVLKRFYQWFKAPPEEYDRWRRKHVYPAEVDDLTSNIKLNERFLPSDLLTEQEVNALVHNSPNLMVKAAIALSDEIGPRPGELLNMRVGDIIFQEKRVICRLGHNGGGKTGERNILIIKSVSLLSLWLENHPLKDEPEAPLWVCLSNNYHSDSWTYNAFRQMLLRLKEELGIKKPLSPYLFRHTAATRDACLGFNEPMLCKKYGWVQGSKMPGTYLHLANNDLYAMIAEKYGGKEGVQEKPKPQTISCSRCHQQNHPGQHFCGSCGEPLQEQEISQRSIELEQQRQKENEKIQEFERQLTELQEKLNLVLGSG